MIDGMEIVPSHPDTTLATQFNSRAILRFGDPTRETTDGAIWKLGSGRPEVIVAMEFTEHGDAPHINYEFLCLTAETFDLRTDLGWTWTPAESALEFHELDAASPPHESAQVRIRQLKALARRFSADESYRGEEFDLRLMPQPIDQYEVDGGDLMGAIFVFANGTNPEVLLILESTADGWQYGLARLCGAAPTVRLDNQVVWQCPSMDDVSKSWKLGYTGDAHPVDESHFGDVE